MEILTNGAAVAAFGLLLLRIRLSNQGGPLVAPLLSLLFVFSFSLSLFSVLSLFLPSGNDFIGAFLGGALVDEKAALYRARLVDGSGELRQRLLAPRYE